MIETSLFCLVLLIQGGLFAANSPYYGWVIPAVGHTVAIGTLNSIYKTVAEKCTDYENHRFMALMLTCVQHHDGHCFLRTAEDWKNSIIGKRVIFEALNCFVAPLYITFYQMDVDALRRVMIRLFWCMSCSWLMSLHCFALLDCHM